MANPNPNPSIPTVDLSPFFQEGNEGGKRKAVDTIRQACEDSGFFQILNHGVPPSLMSRAIEMSKVFFNYPEEEKLKYKPSLSAPLPAGYFRELAKSPDLKEYLFLFVPNAESGFTRFNVYPDDPPEFRKLIEEVSSHIIKTGLLIESILNECLGLPLNFLKEYNSDRNFDSLVALRYFPATATHNMGTVEHEDGNCITFVFQDDTGGLEVLKDGEWLKVTPTPGTIVVNIGDVIKVLSNNKFKSATHRVVSNRKSSRYSYAYFFTPGGEKWVEPLPQFTEQIGKLPEYRGFRYKDYVQQRFRNKTHPPDREEDIIHVSYYAIPT